MARKSLEGYLHPYVSSSQAFLKKFFARKKKEAEKIDPEIKRALEIFESYASGGKKIRGALTVLGYQMAGGGDLEAVLPVSCGIELLHNFLLIHDDIIDKDALRRGKPTVHKQVGDSKAIIVGDIGSFLGYELILSANFPREILVEAFSKLNDFVLKTGYGQMLDIDYDQKKDISWEDIYNVRLYKTAYYTFVMPLSVGATLAKADSPTQKAIETYGVNVGIAFQIADDILGIFGDPKVTGKSNNSDIKEGKKTFLYAKALELAGPADKKFLIKRYGTENLKVNEIEKIRSIFESSGSLEYSKKLALELAANGKRVIKEVTADSKYQAILTELADFVVSRDR